MLLLEVSDCVIGFLTDTDRVVGNVQVAMNWDRERFSMVVEAFQDTDNIAGRSFEERMCLPLPIDIVYTWVNGSDPQLLADLAAVCIAFHSHPRSHSQSYAMP
jgi:UDP-N-acetylglucosamine-lysosomal-enzyme